MLTFLNFLKTSEVLLCLQLLAGCFVGYESISALLSMRNKTSRQSGLDCIFRESCGVEAMHILDTEKKAKIDGSGGDKLVLHS